MRRKATTLIVIVIAAAVAGAATAAPQEAEEEVPLDLLPREVRRVAEAEAEAAGAELIGVEREVERGVVVYEIELSVDGREKEIEVDETGRILEIEEELDVGELAADVRDRLVAEAGGGRVLEAESETLESGVVTYEAVILRPDGSMKRVKVRDETGRSAPGLR